MHVHSRSKATAHKRCDRFYSLSGMETGRGIPDYIRREGNLVAAVGALTTRKWQDSNGNNRVYYDVLCDSVELLESRSNSEAYNNTAHTVNVPQTGAGNATAGNTTQSPQFEELADNDDLPF